MNKKSRFVWFFILFLIATTVVTVNAKYVPGELIVKYKEESNEYKTNFELDHNENNPYKDKIKVLKFNKNSNITKLAEAYSSLDNIEYAEPNYIYSTYETVNDPGYSSQWYLEKVSAEMAWNGTLGNQSIIIAIIDTGVNWRHEDLVDKIWNNTDEDCNESTDLDGNGYFGDCRGYDFVNFSDVSICDVSEDCTIEDNDPSDVQGHGTHCAGIAGAEANNSLGIAGVCPNCKIMPIRAGYKDGGSQGGSLTIADVKQAIDYAIVNNATIISMSFGGSSSSTIRQALQEAYDAGIILVAAAGNDNSQTKDYPAGYDFVISVGATDSSDIKASYSNYGSWVDIVAPGSNIYSTFVPSGYSYLSGTSMATPLVAGAIGLMKSFSPEINQTESLHILNITGHSIDFLGFTINRINLSGALTLLSDPKFISINYDNLSIYNTSNLTMPLEITFNEEVTFKYSINGTDNKTGCTYCRLFNETILLPSYGNLTFNFYIEDLFSNKNSTDRMININKTESIYNQGSYIGEENIPILLKGLLNEISILNVFINNSNNLSISYPYGNYKINLTDTLNQTIIEFNYTLNETNITLDLSNSVVESGNLSSDNKSYLMVRGINLSNKNNKKTIYLPNNIERNIICIKDSEIFSLNEFSTYCNSSDEILLQCPASSGNYSCSLVLNDSYYKISGLSYSAAKETGDICGDGIISGSETCSTCPEDAGSCSPPVERSGSAGGSSGGGGGGVFPPKINTIEPTAYELKQGKNIVAEEKDVVLFKTINGENHNISIDNLEMIYAQMTINSEPIKLVLNQGDEYKLNLSSSKFYDLYIRADFISKDRINIFIKTIFEEIIKDSEPEIIKEEVQVPLYLNYKAYSYLIIAIIILLLILLLNRKLNKLDKENKEEEKIFIEENVKKLNQNPNPNKNDKKIKTKTKRKR